MARNHKTVRLIEILLVEDNPADIRFVSEIFKDGRLANRITAMSNSEDVMRFLRREKSFRNAITPDLIILDLNMPGKDGRQLLREIRSEKATAMIPVIVLTTSAATEDVSLSYDLKADCYMVKPVEFDQFLKVAKCMLNIGVGLVDIAQAAGKKRTVRKRKQEG